MSKAALTLMAVHAHPDDEASSRAASSPVTRRRGSGPSVVTCTDGALGDGHEASKPGDPAHDEAWVVAKRRQ